MLRGFSAGKETFNWSELPGSGFMSGKSPRKESAFFRVEIKIISRGKQGLILPGYPVEVRCGVHEFRADLDLVKTYRTGGLSRPPHVSDHLSF